jgi:hypothetical protein
MVVRAWRVTFSRGRVKAGQERPCRLQDGERGYCSNAHEVGSYCEVNGHRDGPNDRADNGAETPCGMKAGHNRSAEVAFERPAVNVHGEVPRPAGQAQDEQAGNDDRQANYVTGCDDDQSRAKQYRRSLKGLAGRQAMRWRP